MMNFIKKNILLNLQLMKLEQEKKFYFSAQL